MWASSKKDSPGKLTEVGLAMGKVLPRSRSLLWHQTSHSLDSRIEVLLFSALRASEIRWWERCFFGAVAPMTRADADSGEPLLSLASWFLGPDTLLHLKDTVRAWSPLHHGPFTSYLRTFHRDVLFPRTRVHFAIPVPMDFTYECAFNKVLILTLLSKRRNNTL